MAEINTCAGHNCILNISLIITSIAQCRDDTNNTEQNFPVSDIRYGYGTVTEPEIIKAFETETETTISESDCRDWDYLSPSVRTQIETVNLIKLFILQKLLVVF